MRRWDRELALYLMALACAGGLAWRSCAVKPDEKSGRDVVLGSAALAELVSVEFDGPDQKVRIGSHEDRVGRYFVVDFTVLGESAADPDAGVSRNPESNPERFISVDSGKDALTAWWPLHVRRRLPTANASAIAEYGLARPRATLRLKSRSQEQRYSIGSSSPGSSEYYLRDDASGAVYLVGADQVHRLESARERLLEHRLHGFSPSLVRRGTLLFGPQNYAFVPMAGGGGYASAQSPSRRLEALSSWMDKLKRLRPMTYREQLPQAAVSVVRVSYRDDNHELGHLELFSLRGPAGIEYFVQTEYTRWFAALQRGAADSLDVELSTLFR